MYGHFNFPHAAGIGATHVCGCTEGYYELKPLLTGKYLEFTHSVIKGLMLKRQKLPFNFCSSIKDINSIFGHKSLCMLDWMDHTE